MLMSARFHARATRDKFSPILLLEPFLAYNMWWPVLTMLLVSQAHASGMFERLNWLDHLATKQRNYGVAVANVDTDATDFEWIVAGFDGANFVFKFNSTTGRLDNIAIADSPYANLMDVDGRSIGVCACDIDGDGREEIYFLNSNQAYAGRSSYGDKLFKWRKDRFIDLFSESPNDKLDAQNFAGRSVACIDRLKIGRYSIAVATYSEGGTGNIALIEMDEKHPMNNPQEGKIVLKNAAKEAKIDKATGSRGIIVGPMTGKSTDSDIFFNNEGSSVLGNSGANFLFQSTGNGSYKDVAKRFGVKDENENGRGVCMADLNKDTHLDLVYGNWEGKHRIFMLEYPNGKAKFVNAATKEFEKSSKVRTVICADFDNDGDTEIFINNIYSDSDLQPNKLFTVSGTGDSLKISRMKLGDAVEKKGRGTGAVIGDINNDGRLELLISHGEGQPQPLEIYKVADSKAEERNWVRVFPQTTNSAPARGAKVVLESSSGEKQTQVIDSGSGYLCQMEPVAHFGLDKSTPVKLTVFWPDGESSVKVLSDLDTNTLLTVQHPSKLKSEGEKYINEQKDDTPSSRVEL